MGLISIKSPHKYLVTVEEKESDYGQVIHTICCGIKKLSESGLRKIAASEMAYLVPYGAVLIPVPSSKGETAPNVLLAQEIAKIVGGKVVDALGRVEGQSGFELRRAGLPGPDPKTIVHYLRLPIPKGAILIDNVATTGVTLESAAIACGVDVGAVVYAQGDLNTLRQKESLARRKLISG